MSDLQVDTVISVIEDGYEYLYSIDQFDKSTARLISKKKINKDLKKLAEQRLISYLEKRTKKIG